MIRQGRFSFIILFGKILAGILNLGNKKKTHFEKNSTLKIDMLPFKLTWNPKYIIFKLSHQGCLRAVI